MTSPLEAQERAAVVAEALTWQNTPYHHAARVKGGGVDCAMYLAEVYEAVGLMPHIDPGEYPCDWHMHRDEERYLEQVERFAHKIDSEPEPGDIVLYKFGRSISHGAIVVSWPQVIHSYIDLGVVLDDALGNAALSSRYQGCWSLWPRSPEVPAENS